MLPPSVPRATANIVADIVVDSAADNRALICANSSSDNRAVAADIAADNCGKCRGQPRTLPWTIVGMGTDIERYKRGYWRGR